MKKITSVVCDLDGTLLNSAGDVSRSNRIILNQLAREGILIGLASGRRVKEVQKLLDPWDLEETVSFIVGSDGCEYVNLKTGASITEHLLNCQEFDEALRLASHFHLALGIYDEKLNALCFNRNSLYVSLYCLFQRKKLIVRPEMECPTDMELTKFYLVGSRRNIVGCLKEAARQSLTLFPAGKYAIEVISPHSGKFKGLQHAFEDFGLNPLQCMSFGDEVNDLEMLRKTYGIAMKNASEPVCEIARAITKYSASQDGLAYFLNQQLMEKSELFSSSKNADHEKETNSDAAMLADEDLYEEESE